MRTHGLFNHPLFSKHFFQTPAVRHLAWLIHSQPLLHLTEDDSGEALPWPAAVDAALLDLDRHPQPLLAHLGERGARRLGLYFEQLYGYALTAFLGQRILAQNLPLRVAGRTLGELDFLVHDPTRDRVVHHEIAVKFYMGWTGIVGKPAGWYGPDTRDHLGAKLKRLREHQLPMWRSNLGRECLLAEGLPQPQAGVLGLYGYLFTDQSGGAPSLPEGIGPPEPGAIWCRAADHRWLHARDRCQVVVRKPDWLGPVQVSADYQPGMEQVEEVMTEASRRAVLLATLDRTEQGFWLESSRRFLTPDHWCLEPQAVQ